MANGGADSPAPPSENGGEFLLSLLHRRPSTRQSPSQGPDHHHQHQSFSLDPAITAVGPTMNALHPSSNWPSNNDGRDRDRLGAHVLPPWPVSFSPPNRSPNLLGFPQFPLNSRPSNQFINGNSLLLEDTYRLGFIGTGNHTIQPPPPPPQQSEKPKLLFGSFSGDPSQSLLNGNSNNRNPQSFVSNPNPNPNPDLNLLSHHRNHEQRGGFSGGGNYGPIGNNNGRGLTKSTPSPPPPPGFSSNQRRWDRDLGNLQRNNDHSSLWDQNVENVDRLRRLSIQNENRFNPGQQIDRPGPSMDTTSLRALSRDDAEDTFWILNKESEDDAEDTFWLLSKEARGGVEFNEELRQSSKGKKEINGEFDEILDKIGQDVESLLLDDQTEDKDGKKSNRTSREKESRNDNRGQKLLYQRERMVKRYMTCRNDIQRLDAPFIAVYKSLIPAEEELEKQRQLMAQLENLVSREWPQVKLCLYGSCANSFGFPKSDIDVCLAIEDDDVNKSEMLLKLADILESDNLQNVQALTRARVPIVKLMDPVTGISCDICINNLLAVVNTKLLRDYSCIDVRLRQLAFIVKHWAKSRRVNETYQGTLSSYAYVLMCIFFLQQRRPPILPCLQEMDPTYSVRVDNIRCEYFDKVERLSNFGSNNRETIAELVWGFFNYWAYAHDYANNVISVRTASILGKREKDWTRRVGNDRHLICIEDPFETSHDLGRVVDKFSIRVLREEFERAAKIMQQEQNPCAKLFEPYLPPGDNYNNNGHHQQGGHN